MPTVPSYTPAADIARDRDHLISRFIATRSQSEQIAGRLSVEDQQVQSMPDVSPTNGTSPMSPGFLKRSF